MSAIPDRSVTGRYLLFLFFTACTLFIGCKQGPAPAGSYQPVLVQGRTMGTTYNVKFEEQTGYLNYQYEIDSILVDVNDALSHYVPSSLISGFNLADTTFSLPKTAGESRVNLLNGYFMSNFRKSRDVWKLTRGAFDPTVGPLVNFWGFGTGEKKEVGKADTAVIKGILQLVGLDQVSVEETMAAYRFKKSNPEVRLDFSALAKGFGVDEVSKLLEKRGIANYMVEIGGEVRCRGENPSGNAWKLGISQPETDAPANRFFATISLTDAAMASSGNYRNYYIRDGIKRFHSINPQTGFPEENRMRSATIIAPDCMTADALATACMVMGAEKAKSMVYTIDGIKAFLIYENNNGELEHFATAGVEYQLAR